VVGVSKALATTGGVLEIVTVFEVAAAPAVVPSLGVAVQATVLPVEKYVPVRVLVVGAIVEPFTFQV
jgi:hypothetical protein